MKKLRHLILGLMLLVCGSAFADSYAYLTVTQGSGDTSYAVSSISRITFDASDMVLHLSDGKEARLPLSGLSKMFFSDQASAIATVGAPTQQITMKNGVLRVTAPQGSVVTVYDTNGKIVRTQTAQEAETEVNLSGVVNGVYIVKVGSEAKKILKK